MAELWEKLGLQDWFFNRVQLGRVISYDVLRSTVDLGSCVGH